MRRYFPYEGESLPSNPAHEIGRWEVHCGEMIVFASVEEHVWEDRQTGEFHNENRPVLRAIVQATHLVGQSRPFTLFIEGLMPNGAVERRVTLDVPALQPGHSIGYMFPGGHSQSVRFVGWELEV